MLYYVGSRKIPRKKGLGFTIKIIIIIIINIVKISIKKLHFQFI